MSPTATFPCARATWFASSASTRLIFSGWRVSACDSHRNHGSASGSVFGVRIIAVREVVAVQGAHGVLMSGSLVDNRFDGDFRRADAEDSLQPAAQKRHGGQKTDAAELPPE